jgi:hypothetical protein
MHCPPPPTGSSTLPSSWPPDREYSHFQWRVANGI